jgi:hypothetical protein
MPLPPLPWGTVRLRRHGAQRQARSCSARVLDPNPARTNGPVKLAYLVPRAWHCRGIPPTFRPRGNSMAASSDAITHRRRNAQRRGAGDSESGRRDGSGGPWQQERQVRRAVCLPSATIYHVPSLHRRRLSSAPVRCWEALPSRKKIATPHAGVTETSESREAAGVVVARELHLPSDPPESRP